MIKGILIGIHILVCLILIGVVLLQKGKSAGLSGSIAGGAETFFGKNKARTMEGGLSRLTTVGAIIFIITSMALTFIYVRV